MRQNGLQVRPLRKFVRTTDSDHNGPIFLNLARGFRPTGLNQLWVGDITYIRVAAGVVYLAVILGAWSRRVIGCALSRSADGVLVLRIFGLHVPPALAVALLPQASYRWKSRRSLPTKQKPRWSSFSIAALLNATCHHW